MLNPHHRACRVGLIAAAFMLVFGAAAHAGGPPTAIDLGTLSPGVPVVVNVPSVPRAARQFYTFTLEQPVRMQDLTFLDISTVVPVGGGGTADSEVGIYDAAGNLVVCDDDDGEGFRSSISFGSGSGTRPQGSDQQVHNGRDGDLPAGTYYLRIAAWAISFNSERTNWGLSLNGGSATLIPSTITLSLGAAIALPDPPGTADMGDVVLGTSINSEGNDMPASTVRFFKFRVPEISDESKRHLDIDTEGTNLAPANDTTIAIYLPTGALASTNNVLPASSFDELVDEDDAQGLHSLLSFGLASPARPPVGDGETYHGDSGTLRPGTYYLAIGGPGNTPRVDNVSGVNFGFTSASPNAGTVSFNIHAGDGGCEVGWRDVFDGSGALNGPVRAIAQWDASGLPRLFQWNVIAGSFTKVGATKVNRIAFYNPTALGNWEALGEGFSGNVNALIATPLNGNGPTEELIAGGSFTKSGATTINRVARFDGTNWVQLGSGFNGAVNALCTHDFDGNGPGLPDLIAAGAFSKSGTTTVNRIAVFNVSADKWQPLGAGFNTTVNALASIDLDGPGGDPPVLYVGGAFAKSNNLPVLRIAKWVDPAFVQVGAGFNKPVLSIVAHDDDGNGPNSNKVYCAGQFTKSGLTSLSRVAVFNGTDFLPLAAGLNNTVNVLKSYDPDGLAGAPPLLLAGGTFTKSGLVTLNRLAKWSGTAWGLVDGQSADGAVRAIELIPPPASIVNTPQVWFGGDFKVIGGIARRAIGSLACTPVTGAPLAPLRFGESVLPPLAAQTDEPAPCSIADVCGPGGVGSKPDGIVDSSDMLTFVYALTEDDIALADVAGKSRNDGTDPGPDFALTVDDVIAFVRAFVDGCDR